MRPSDPKIEHGHVAPYCVRKTVVLDRAIGVDQIDNYVRLSDRIATAGQPTETEFLSIRKAGFRAVVNLALSNSDNALQDERSVLSRMEMDYVQFRLI